MSAAPAKEKPQAPPEERFWKRYSPHGEAPLSVAGSFAAHALGVGGLILVAVYLATLFVKPTPFVPVEPVRVLEKPGVGGMSGDGHGARVEDVGARREDLPADTQGDPRLPALDPIKPERNAQEFDAAKARWIGEVPSGSARTLAGISDSLRTKLRGNKDGPGPGGGGKKGPPGNPIAKEKLTQSQKRSLRWHMHFTANSGLEYLQQLKSLGAILAFPLGERPNLVYHVVHDLRPGARAGVEDVAALDRISWYDDKPRSVEDVLAALRLQLPGRPVRFIAFMPKALEDKLYAMERNYVRNILRRRFVEDDILETTFRCVGSPTRGYQPELISVTMR